MTTITDKQRQFPCRQCGAILQFEPGQSCLKCPYCQTENEIAVSDQPIEELDFHSALADQSAAEELQEALTVKCAACGAESTLSTNVTASDCPFCGSPIVATGTSTKHIRPSSLLPFAIKRDQALAAFRKWIHSLWFAPGELRRYAEAGTVRGVYIPYWTYDCDTWSTYTGERGENYTIVEHYTVMENGRSVTKTRHVTKIRWWPVSGQVYNPFDDILILASNTLPRHYTELLEPWDLQNLVPYADDYLAGFTAESYQIGLEQGFGLARQAMDSPIRQSICRDIGGDHQRIHSVKTRYDHITFKHILLPLWISAYRYRERTYRFLVNARTGEVSGERPYSAIKIAIAVMLVVAIIALISLFVYLQ